MGHIVILSGPPGAGKSTIARRLAENSPHDRAIHMHTDDFYNSIRKGYIEPWKPESGGQNITVSKAMVSCAKCFAENGYEVLVDGVIGPWYLTPWIETLHNGIPVYYVILRPGIDTVILRNENREKELDRTVITHMWNAFADLGLYESHVINSTSQSPEETALAIRNRLPDHLLHR